MAITSLTRLVVLVTMLVVHRVQAQPLRTPLHHAALNGDVAAAEAALAEGGSIKAVSEDGHTPLHDAALRGRHNVASLLLNRGSDVGVETWDGVTALHIAAAGGHSAVVKLLLENGARPDAPARTHKETPLHRAAGSGSVEAVRLLLDRGAPITTDKYGYTPLHTAAATGHSEVALMLLSHGADPAAFNEEGKTVLDVARRYGHLEAIEGVLSRATGKDEI